MSDVSHALSGNVHICIWILQKKKYPNDSEWVVCQTSMFP